MTFCRTFLFPDRYSNEFKSIIRMAAHSIKTVQKIPVSIEEAWNFFSSPANLQAITPANIGF